MPSVQYEYEDKSYSFCQVNSGLTVLKKKKIFNFFSIKIIVLRQKNHSIQCLRLKKSFFYYFLKSYWGPGPILVSFFCSRRLF